MTITTRRQALQSGRDITDATGSVVEFPHGLPPAPPRKQKDKLSEVEHQLKKAEAAQRRRIQAAKAAKESEAEAIRKILGQDSSRKKRENKMKQRQEELAQERNLNAATLASNTVRWVIRPTGTVVTFSDDIGLPNILESRPCSHVSLFNAPFSLVKVPVNAATSFEEVKSQFVCMLWVMPTTTTYPIPPGWGIGELEYRRILPLPQDKPESRETAGKCKCASERGQTKYK
nr:INO80 complex subunit B-like isoform X1 [Tanacetum cinerariifolium]